MSGSLNQLKCHPSRSAFLASDHRKLVLATERILRRLLGTRVRVPTTGGKRTTVRRLRGADTCNRSRGRRSPTTVRHHGRLGVQLTELAFQVRLEPTAVLTLEGAQF